MSTRGAIHLAESQKWSTWQRDNFLHLAAQLSIAWNCKLSEIVSKHRPNSRRKSRAA